MDWSGIASSAWNLTSPKRQTLSSRMDSDTDMTLNDPHADEATKESAVSG
jgi:hypothetical protein